MGDFHELRLEFRRVWSPVHVNNSSSTGNSNSSSDRISYRSTRTNTNTTGNTGSSSNYHRISAGATSTHHSGNNSATGTPSRSRNANLTSDRQNSSVSNSNYRATTPQQQQQEGGNREYTSNSTIGSSSGNVSEVSPGVRFCHVGVVYDSAFYIFGGYDGSQR